MHYLNNAPWYIQCLFAFLAIDGILILSVSFAMARRSLIATIQVNKAVVTAPENPVNKNNLDTAA